MRRLPRRNEGRRSSDAARCTWGRGLFAAILAFGLATATVAYELGHSPAFGRLGELVAGTTRTGDVIAVLGEPQGRGKAQLTPDIAPMDVLFYESSVMEGTKVRMKMLMVFVDSESGTYQGYLWFAGGLIVGKKE
jgi:hypothetical protein